MALYQISPKIVHFALSRHQERNLKIRIHMMKDNINAVILIPKLRRSDYPRDRSNWRKIFTLKISKSIYSRKIAWAGPNISVLSDNSHILFHMDRSKYDFDDFTNFRFYFEREPLRYHTVGMAQDPILKKNCLFFLRISFPAIQSSF